MARRDCPTGAWRSGSPAVRVTSASGLTCPRTCGVMTPPAPVTVQGTASSKTCGFAMVVAKEDVPDFVPVGGHAAMNQRSSGAEEGSARVVRCGVGPPTPAGGARNSGQRRVARRSIGLRWPFVRDLSALLSEPALAPMKLRSQLHRSGHRCLTRAEGTHRSSTSGSRRGEGSTCQRRPKTDLLASPEN